MQRERLFEWLRAVPTDAHIVLRAPAGFGKTTLLAQWDVRQESVPFAWVNVDRGDNDPTAMLGWIIESLLESSPEVSANLPISLRQGGVAAMDVVLDTLLDQLGRASRQTVLVLNELEHCTSPDSTRLVEELLGRAPRNLTIVVATREAVPEAVSSNGPRLVELDARALAFTVSEAEQLLLAVSGRPAGQRLASTIIEQTEGWPAAACLLATSGTAATGAARASTDHEGELRVEDYVAREVVDSLDDETLDFAVRSSVLDQMTPQLCAATLDDPSAAQRLRDLASANPLVSVSPGPTAWYRYHGLLLGPLRHRLHAQHPDRLAVLHGRAAHWLEEAGLVDDALGHAAQSGDTALLGGMVGRHWSTLVVSGRNTRVQRLLRQFSDDAIDADAELSLAAAWTAGLAGDVDTFRRRLPHAEVVQPERPGGGFAARRSAPAMLRLFLTQDRLSDLLDRVQQSALAERHHRTPWQATAQLALGWIRYLLGERGSLEAFLLGARLAVGEEPLVRSELLADAAIVASERDDRDRARHLADESLGIVHELGLADHPHTWATFVAQGLVLSADPAAHDAAIRAAERGVSLAAPIGAMSPWQPTVAFYHQARVGLAVGDLEGAQEAFRRAEELVVRYGHDDTDFTSRLATLRERLADAPDDLGRSLTSRERRILRLLAGTMTQPDIARELGISPNTVKTHVRSIYRKLDVSSRDEALGLAQHRHLV